jgi:hypothetical protein
MKSLLAYHSVNLFVGLAEYFCESGEEISTVKLVPAPSGVYICLGTVFGSKADVEPTKGRLVFLRAGVDNHFSSAIQLSEVANVPVHGCVYALAILDQLLAVAVDYSVKIFHQKIIFDTYDTVGHVIQNLWIRNVQSLSSC